jgi:GNAT superfamily N-acetyltransferase
MPDPREYVAAETLKNGLAVTIRALRPGDRERIAQAIRGLDPQSIYLRLFSQRKLTEAGLDRVMKFDPATEVVLLTTIGDGADETVIGGGRYVVSKPRVAEVAFTVEEDYHGQGIASRLLRHLARVARDQGIDTLEADVLAENRPMRVVFEKTGWPTQTRREGGTVHFSMTLPARGDRDG